MAFIDMPVSAQSSIASSTTEIPVDPKITATLADSPKAGPTDAEKFQFSELVADITAKWMKARDSRRGSEMRWLQAYRNYRGEYGPSVTFREDEKCRVFIKITKTKVLAIYGQIVDVLWSGNRFPLAIEATPVPVGIKEAVHIDPKEAQQAPPSPYGFPGDGNDLEPGATHSSLGPLADKLEGLNVKDGASPSPTAMNFYPAQAAAKKMDKKIQDQLQESDASRHLRHVAMEACIYGTGIMKGPFIYEQEYPRWTDGPDGQGIYNPIIKEIPKLYAMSIWNAYPDPDGTDAKNIEWFIERHKTSRSGLRDLKKRPGFRGKAIEYVISQGPKYNKEHWEDVITDSTNSLPPERWEVLEYWGVIDADKAKASGLKIPKEFRGLDQLQINCWVVGNVIIRLVLNPYRPNRMPYTAVPLEYNEKSFFGVGVAENMDDTQTLMNGFMRLAVDNGVLSGNVVYEIDESFMTNGQDWKVYPGKIFRRNMGQAGQGIYVHKFPNTSQENLQMFDKARQLADEAVGSPSYSHGQTGVTGTTRTASGMSMLMNAAAINIKNVIKNFDDYLLKPLGEALFAFNMQFDYDKDIKGDLAIMANGTESLMQNEVRSQRIIQFLQVLANPALAPYGRYTYLVQEVAKTLDLDPEKAVNSPEEAVLQAMKMQAMGVQPQGAEGSPIPAGGPQGGSNNPGDPTGAGGGNIGTGSAPPPGAPGHSANTGQQAA